MSTKRGYVESARELLNNAVAPFLASVDAVIVSAEGGTLAPAGSILAATWSTYSTHGRMKRVEETLTRIQKLLTPKVILNSFAASPAGMQLLENILYRVEIEHCEKKRERFANLIAASWIADEPVEGAFDELLHFADANIRFTDSHVSILMRLYERGDEGSLRFGELAELVEAEPGRGRDELGIIILHDLCTRFGFARRAWGLNVPNFEPKLLFTGNLSPENMAFNCRHAISTRGQRYVDYVIKGPPLSPFYASV